jgi:phage major head subunit gpT-like protein
MLAAGIVINPANIQGLYKSWNTIFNQALSAAQPQWQKIAMEIPSTTLDQGYAWLGAWPKLREFIGERQIKKLAANNYTIRNKTFESTVQVERAAIEDDQYGVYGMMMAAMGTSVRLHPDELIFGLLNGGFTTIKSYDGYTLYSANHASGSNTAVAALSFATGGSYAIAKAALGRVKDSEGRPLFYGSERDILVVGPEMDEKARTGLNADFISIASGSTQNNPWKNSADLVVSPQITSATAWFLIRPFAGLMPLIHQTRIAPEFVEKTNPNQSDLVFMHDLYIYGVRVRWNAGVGLHQLTYGSTGAS